MVGGRVDLDGALETSGMALITIEASRSALIALGFEILILFGGEEETVPFFFLYWAKSFLNASNYLRVIPIHQ